MERKHQNEIILIKKSPSTEFKEANSVGECSLTHNCFDPTSGSPPNNFIMKLQNRMSAYFEEKDLVLSGQ